MNKEEVLRKLNELNVNPSHYSLGYEIKDNAINVELLYNGTYAVYDMDRGEKIGIKIFKTESEAFEELLERIKDDLQSSSMAKKIN